MSVNQLPYTNVHELNLDWIISKILEFQANIDDFREAVEEMQGYYAQIDALTANYAVLSGRVTSNANSITEINAALSTLSASLGDLANELAAEATARSTEDQSLQNQIDKLKNTIIDAKALERTIKKYVDAKCKILDIKIDDLENRMNYKLVEIYIELRNEISELRELLESLAVNVYNWNAYDYAENGRINFDLNNKLIYQHTGNNLTAEEYCSLGLTAAQYAAYNLTAYRYLIQSRKELHYDYVFMPVSGSRQNVSVALSDSLTFILNTMTASEYAALDLSAEEYAALDITSKEYLLLNNDLGIRSGVYYSTTGTGLTAEQYSKLIVDERS